MDVYIYDTVVFCLLPPAFLSVDNLIGDNRTTDAGITSQAKLRNTFTEIILAQISLNFR